MQTLILITLKLSILFIIKPMQTIFFIKKIGKNLAANQLCREKITVIRCMAQFRSFGFVIWSDVYPLYFQTYFSSNASKHLTCQLA